MSELIERHVKADGYEFYVLRGQLGGDVLWNVGYSGTPGYTEFLEDFEYLGGRGSDRFLGDPEEDHYQGTLFTQVIRRRSDGALFGSGYWTNPGIDSIEGYAAGPDAESMGVEVDWDNGEEEPVIFVPVRKFTRVGYSLVVLSGS